MIEMGVIEPPPPGAGPFALGDDGVLEQLVRDAGFDNIRSDATVAVYETRSPAACTQWLRDVAPPITEMVADQPDAVQQQVWQRASRKPGHPSLPTVLCDCRALRYGLPA